MMSNLPNNSLYCTTGFMLAFVALYLPLQSVPFSQNSKAFYASLFVTMSVVGLFEWLIRRDARARFNAMPSRPTLREVLKGPEVYFDIGIPIGFATAISPKYIAEFA